MAGDVHKVQHRVVRGVGWKAIGRDPDHMFQPPFGFYDKDYPGWEPAPASSEKTKS